MARKGEKVSEETRAKMAAAQLGKRHTEESRAKISAAKRGKPLSADHRAKISAAGKGKKRSEEARAKMRAASLLNKQGPLSPMWGKKHSEESRAKISAANKGKKRSEEFCAKMSIANRGRVLSDEHRAKLSAANRGNPKVLENIAVRSVANRGSASPRWGKPPAHGKRIEHKGHVFRSSYEVRCADALDRKGIKWEYEPRRFDLGDCTYLPDFYLPEQDVYWEVKGWLGPNSQRKINRFREVHPDIPLVVVTNTVLKLMEA